MKNWIVALACIALVGCSDGGSNVNNGEQNPADSDVGDAGDVTTDADPSGADAADGGADTVTSDAADADRDPTPHSGEPVALEDFAGAFAQAYCAQMFGCCAAGERETFAYGSEGTEQDCVDKARSHFYTTHVNGVSEAEQDGLLHYDAEKAGACLAQVTQDCSTVRLGPQKFTDQCEPYLLPQLEKGAECTSFAFCKTGHCLGVVDDFEGTLGDQTGICAEAQPGDECQSFGCGDDHYCDVDQDLGKFVCFELREDGADCRQPFECVSDYCGERDPNAGDFDGICAPTPQLCDGTE